MILSFSILYFVRFLKDFKNKRNIAGFCVGFKLLILLIHLVSSYPDNFHFHLFNGHRDMFRPQEGFIHSCQGKSVLDPVSSLLEKVRILKECINNLTID